MKKLIVIFAALAAATLGYVAPAYRVDHDLGISRALAGLDPRFLTYHRFFLDIEPGMSRAQVEETLTKHYPPGGKRMPPKRITDDGQQLFLFLNPEHLKEPNCESISIHFRDGIVVSKDYTMD